jgi:hypothetical protein
MASRGKESGTFRSARVAAVDHAFGDSADGLSLPEADLEHLVANLNAIHKTATLIFALEVGKLVVEHFYAGDLEIWRNRTKKKDSSLRRLSRHPDLRMSPSALYRSVAIYELCERLNIRTWKYISTGHIRLVLPLGRDEQARLLMTAETERWSVRELDARVEAETRSQRGVRSHRGGITRVGALRRMIRPLKDFVAAVRGTAASADSATLESEFSPDSTRDAIDLLHSVVDACKTVEARLCPNLADPVIGHGLETRASSRRA